MIKNELECYYTIVILTMRTIHICDTLSPKYRLPSFCITELVV